MNKIVILGSGLSGSTAALKLAMQGAAVTLVSPAYAERSQSVMAMGGINAALNTKGEEDSVEQHFVDTMQGGSYLGDPEAVDNLVRMAPGIVRWLAEIGVNFTRDEAGRVDLRNFGGQKKKRTAYAGARTGKQIMAAVIAGCRKYEAAGTIQRLTGWRFHSLILEGAECAGAVIIEERTQALRSITADAVIMAVGGPNGVFGHTTGSRLNDGYAAGALLAQGVEFANLEMVQYHPTTVLTATKQMLITEAARGVGGRLFVMKDGQPWYFMEEWYPERGALMPRDVVSQSIYKVCNELKLGIGGGQTVYLDISHLPKAVIDSQLDEVVTICRTYLNLNPYAEPIPVSPGIHYFMGGIKTDKHHRTNIGRLFAAGECSAQYHGANRLGGNSLLGAVCGGMVAAQSAGAVTAVDGAAADEAGRKALAAAADELERWKGTKASPLSEYAEIRSELSTLMYGSMGIYRKERELLGARRRLAELEQRAAEARHPYSYYEDRTLYANLLLAKAMVESALERKESRGAHQRTDFSEKNDRQFKKPTNARVAGGSITVDFG
ncbi:FAD-binding protein [Paenibacillus tengchongensis]|uniref:FAD-binding protein n=1 Tax=Paenibacillus tengchongensis TaxID=2608684 RepID=UPI00124F2267|nr:FAD-binding protein [Paenibacillus tengchongensis]